MPKPRACISQVAVFVARVTMDHMTLTEFLLARIAEDEALASSLGHIPQWGSGRSMAECKARRKIVEDNIRLDRALGSDDWVMGYSDGIYYAVCALAEVYADHPDYQKEWRP